MKNLGSHLQFPGQGNSTEIGRLGVVAFSGIIGLGGQEMVGLMGEQEPRPQANLTPSLGPGPLLCTFSLAPCLSRPLLSPLPFAVLQTYAFSFPGSLGLLLHPSSGLPPSPDPTSCLAPPSPLPAHYSSHLSAPHDPASHPGLASTWALWEIFRVFFFSVFSSSPSLAFSMVHSQAIMAFKDSLMGQR